MIIILQALVEEESKSAIGYDHLHGCRIKLASAAPTKYLMSRDLCHER